MVVWDAKMHRRFWRPPDGYADWIFMREIQEKIKKSNELHVSLEEIEVDFDERHRNSVSLAVQVEGFFWVRISSQNSDSQVYQEIYNGPDTAYTKVDLWRCWEKVMFWAQV